MNAGKSTALLQTNYSYLEKGMKTILYTSAKDTRYGSSEIVSRIGIKSKAKTFKTDDNLFEQISIAHTKCAIDCVLIDEAQFLTKDQVSQLGRVVDELDITVLAYGIRTDFQGELFEGSQYLLAWSDHLNEIRTVCHCGRKATMIVRVNEQGEIVREGEQIEIGGNERYLSLCRLHFYQGITEKA
jgi:thymidine kinase